MTTPTYNAAPLYIRMTGEQRERLDRAAQEMGAMGVSTLVRMIIAEWLDRRDREAAR